MVWQDFIFLAGSVLSIAFLAPTVRNSSACVPLGSSVPSMTIGAIYAFTYATMGMTFSAAGSIGVATMWSLIAFYRAPGPVTGPKAILRFVESLPRQALDLLSGARGNPQGTADHDQAAD
ncbi:hypothetical protein [Natronolimnohabitans innermongolicus]|uniref:Uncharacterized protein n=1 Tax=Natronolimnohabitans innermongolicus JCM 12255 TaxID=1227499 RepID=L9X1N7_9EURY|nr:hypothetical protein [Natronolimnohabitans innermongolicus]ELY55640.1 hypothetical protein C493_11072 [Natronolimnohabitans innermongolicus JCM 12255]